MFEVYEVGGQEVAFDLVNRTMRLKAELRNYLSSPIERRNSNSRDTAYWSAWEVIAGVPLYGQSSDDVDDDYKPKNCGPTSGAMIVDYYRIQLNYTLFDSWTDNHDALYDTMDTNNWCWPYSCPGTLPGLFATGWTDYADDQGYDFDYSVKPGWGWGQTWNEVTESIDDDRPLGVMFAACGSAPDFHWNAIKGYGTWVDSNGNTTDWMVVNDPAGTDGFDGIVSWSANWTCLTLVTLEPD